MKTSEIKKIYLAVAIAAFVLMLPVFSQAADPLNICSCGNSTLGIFKPGIDSQISSDGECNQFCANKSYSKYTFNGSGVKNVTASANAVPVQQGANNSCKCDNGPTTGVIWEGRVNTEEECKFSCVNQQAKRFIFNNIIWREIGAQNSSQTQATQATSKFDYKMMEGLPGFFAPGSSTDLPGLILGIYNFGIWTVGIAAFFMLIIGGFMYMTAAGNTSRAGNAKGVITDALLGIAVALLAYLILYVINPDLTKIKLDMITVEVRDTSGATPLGTGICTPITDNSKTCSVSNLKDFVAKKRDPNIDPDLWAMQASSICNAESEGSASAESGKDFFTCNGKKFPVSIGLFQINTSVHNIGGVNCPSAFIGSYNGKKDQSRCGIKNEDTYRKCVDVAKNPNNNLEAMWQVYKAGWGNKKYSWWPWGVNDRCRFSPGGKM